MYKKALQQKLRIATPKGYLSVEQLWDLSFKDLIISIKGAKKVLSETSDDDELAFLETESKTNPTHKLTFDILKDVYLTKREEKNAIKKAAEDKEHNERIMERIYRKQESKLDELSEEELRKLMK